MGPPWGSPRLPRRPRKATKAAKTSQYASKKTAQDGAKRARNGPMTAQDGLIMAQGGPRDGSRGFQKELPEGLSKSKPIVPLRLRIQHVILAILMSHGPDEPRARARVLRKSGSRKLAWAVGLSLLGMFVGVSWEDSRGFLETILKTLEGRLGAFCGALGAFWRLLGGPLGASFRSFGGLLGPLEC